MHDYHARKLSLRRRSRRTTSSASRSTSAAVRAELRAGRTLIAELLRQTTDLIMGRVRDQLAELRGEPAPAGFAPRPGASCPGTARRRRVTRAAVLGAGSWGTTFAKVLADAGCAVTLHARRPELARPSRPTRENADYLPGVRLPSRCGPRRMPPRRSTAPTSSSSPCRRSRCGRT